MRGWQSWHRSLTSHGAAGPHRALYDISAAVLRTHESKRVEGGVIASLSVPWGFSKGDNDLGGYHLIWPRDLVQTATGFIAIGARHEARRILRYLRVTQEADGHWSQNMWLDGTPYWHGTQMDETALPILLIDLAAREGMIDCRGSKRVSGRWRGRQRHSWHGTAPSASRIGGRKTPATRPSRLRPRSRRYWWLPRWPTQPVRQPPPRISARPPTPGTRASSDGSTLANTALTEEHGVDGYYVRVSEPDEADAISPFDGYVPLKNRPLDESYVLANSLVSLDALAFVRFGLREPDDQRILDTIKVIDATLKVETPRGVAWRRYQGDGYGEKADGTPFDGTGIGRAWPLLTGERAHYELAAGRRDAAEQLIRDLEKLAGESGLLPEQVWDTADIPEHELFCGQATGSARPLVWAHAEYLKLCRSLRDGRVFDRPPQTVKRYLVDRTHLRPRQLALQ